RGMGLLLALQFDDTIAAKVVAASNDEGLLLNPVRPDAIRFMPPLIVTEAEVDEAMAKLDRGLARALANGNA
ncbi:MAG: aminotransferase class III-fold pyridoxal phosphate-dependent enzyme, partial [Chloroflexi bacterium]|nr:aminotransferase class III-fold pyridoxal phosphate-dependent enzyme [Chloroflexota bacterium]